MDPLKSPEAIRAEQLLRQAQLAKLRKQPDIAAKLLAEAAEAAPDDVDVLVAQGDDFVERSQFQKALESFDRARKADPHHADAERKYGEMVLKTKGIEDMFNMDAPAAPDGMRLAPLLNIFLPGLGQYVAGQTRKASLFFLPWLTGWIIAGLIPGGISGLGSLFSRSQAEFQPVVLAPLLVSAIAWLASISDAGSAAKKATPRKIERPTPPVDKPF